VGLPQSRKLIYTSAARAVTVERHIRSLAASQ